jgi:hypothetical protein
MKGGTMRRKIRSARCVVHPRIFGATGATGAKGINGSIWARGKRQEKREQQDLQGRESKIWIIYSEAGASLTIIRLN